MNKTVNINLGGMFFHIDEDAYQKLSRYFESIKRQLSDSDGKDEIMSDIEYRISELFSEKLKSDKQVISMKDLDEVIAIMGEPKDYRLDEEDTTTGSTYSSRKTKKLYRDVDNNVLGGVLGGLSHYIGIDVVWLRILMLILFLFYGTGGLLYIILWIVIPKAVTTTEKLEMRGEAVNISNIEKKVREEFENISEKVNNIDYEKYQNKVQEGAKKVGNSLSDFFLGFLNVIGKIIGIVIIMFAIGALASLIIALITLGSTDFFQLPWMGISEAFNYSEVPVWVLVILFFLAIGIPFLGLLILGFRILISNSKSIGKVFKYSMLGIWIVSVIALIVIGIRQATEIAFEEKVSQTHLINTQPSDTLKVSFSENNRFKKSNRYTDFKLVLDQNEKEVLYSNNVKLYLKKSKKNQPYIIVNQFAGGNSLLAAKKRAEEIRYDFLIDGNELVFDDYLLVDLKSKFRNQSVDIEVYIPENQVFSVDDTIKDYWYKVYIEAGRYEHQIKANHFYVFKDNTYKCLDCEDVEDHPKTINDTVLDLPEQGRLKISEDGTIITNN